MAAGIPEDVPPVAAHEAQAFQAFVIDGVTKQLQKDNKAERLPEFIRAAGAYGKGDLDADSFLLTLSDLFGEQRSLKLLPSLARLVKNDDRRRSLLKAARGGAVEVLGADSPNGGAAAPAPPAAVSAPAPEPVAPAPPAELPAAVAAPPAPATEEPEPPAAAQEPAPPAPEPSPPASPAPEAPTKPAPEASAPEPPAQAPAPAPAAPAAAGDAKKKKKKKKKGRRRAGSAGSADEPAPAGPAPEAADARPEAPTLEAPTPAAETPDEPSTPTPTVPADPALFTPRPATPEPTVPADPSLFTPVAFAAASREMIEELTAPDIIPQSNVLPTDAVAGAQAAADERAQAGYDADGNQGGPYTEDKPPPGLAFGAYRKGCTGIVWKAAESTKEATVAAAPAPAEPSEPAAAAAAAEEPAPAEEAPAATAKVEEPESAAAGEAEWERQLAALEAEKKAQQAAAEEAKAPESSEKRRAVAAFTAAENWQMSVKEGNVVEATKDHEDGWTECRYQDRTGAVPTTYLEKVVEPSPEKSTLATGNEAAELQRDAVRRVRARLDQLKRSERLPELVQGTRRYAAGDLTASGMRSALADLLSSDEEARIVCRTLARLVVDDTKRAALAAAAEAPAQVENEDFFAAVARDTAELRQQKSEEEDRRVSTSSAAEDEREILLARSHGVGVSPDVVTRLQRLQEDEELAKRLQREEERRKSNSYAELSRQRTDAALAERLARTPAPEPPKEQSFWGSLFGEDEEVPAPPHSPETDRKVQEDADAALARRLQAEEHARAARRRAPAVYDTPTYSQPAVQYDQYGRPSQAPYRQPQPPPPPAYASEPSVDEYGRPVMQQQTRAPSYAPPPRQDYEPQARRYVPPAPPPAPPPYAHSMRGSLGSAPYARPAAAPAPPPAPPVVEEAGDLFSCGACGAQMQVRGAEPGAQFTCTECGAVNEI